MANPQRTQGHTEQVEDMPVADKLHLPSLSISGFRGIDRLDIPKLGRVTLIVGDNGIGKTTVLEAARLYASRGDSALIMKILESREEIREFKNARGEWEARASWPAVFHREPEHHGERIAIGTLPQIKDGRGLVIEEVALDSDSPELQHYVRQRGEPSGTYFRLMGSYEGIQWRLNLPELETHVPTWIPMEGTRPENLFDLAQEFPGIQCVVLGPGLPDNDEIVEQWDKTRNGDVRERVVSALQSIAGADLEDVGLSGIFYQAKPTRPRVAVTTKGSGLPMPLKRFGDGAYRFFGLALALSNSAGGLLLIDEAENGIHYSRHEEYWRMVIDAAIANDTQVLATTHSFDCVAGFARAADTIADDVAMLVRLDRTEEGGIKPVWYTQELLSGTIDYGIEVR